MTVDIKFKAREFWVAVHDIADADTAMKRAVTTKNEATVDLNTYAVAIAYLLYPWYVAHARAVDWADRQDSAALDRVMKLVRVSMQNPAMKAPDSMFRKFVFSGRLVPGDERVPLVMVDHDTAQEIVSFIVSRVGTTPGPLPQGEHDTLVQLAQSYYNKTIKASAPEAPPALDVISKAKSLLCLIDDLDVEVLPKSLEKIKAAASGRSTASAEPGSSYTPVWVNPAFKLAKNIGNPPFNIVVHNAPDNSKDETDVNK